MQQLKIKIKPNSKTQSIEKKGEIYLIRVKSPPKEGKANLEMLEILSDYFGVPKTHIKIKQGLKSRNKIIILPKI